MVWSLGDKRLEARAQLSVDRIRENPEVTFPGIFKVASELEGFYRFINNQKIDDQILAESLYEQTAKTSRGQKTILILHDTTDIEPSISDDVLRDFKPLRKADSSKGFLFHLSLAVASSGERQIFGPCGVLN